MSDSTEFRSRIDKSRTAIDIIEIFHAIGKPTFECKQPIAPTLLVFDLRTLLRRHFAHFHQVFL